VKESQHGLDAGLYTNPFSVTLDDIAAVFDVRDRW